MIPLSVLDLVPVRVGDTPADAFRYTLDLARHADEWGFTRYWMAEHHNMTGIASAATSVVIGYVANGTKRIRVGAGGIMLPNHSPLVIAEQFGTLESLFPGRIDLGLGRAPGTDQVTMRAMRRDPRSAERFPEDVAELQAFFGPVTPGQAVRAVPGAGLNVPLWILGSSLYGAQVAAHFGLPYAFASHFAPDALMQALEVYRQYFRPSAQLQKPHAMVGVNVIVADTDDEARRLFTSLQQRFTNMLRNQRGQMSPPIDDIEQYWTPAEKHQVMQMLSCSFAGSRDTVKRLLDAFIEKTGADELMVSGAIFDHAARLRSYELLGEIGRM
ncbi:MAG: LLM class flavin-dependent oxidoreductase [Burkholderiaceae bacterium]|nr:LLM class flavin-dependent oxidoreductase [Burkholderiaceae bacterium]MBP7659576.1 LLM class flavin-dependent oxidoreductase [Burkholderiaceae bacterium]